MTRHLPPEALYAARALPVAPRAAAHAVFRDRPPWMVQASLAALADFRPDLGIVVARGWLATHLWQWPRDYAYFVGVCTLLKRYGVGEP